MSKTMGERVNKMMSEMVKWMMGAMTNELVNMMMSEMLSETMSETNASLSTSNFVLFWWLCGHFELRASLCPCLLPAPASWQSSSDLHCKLLPAASPLQESGALPCPDLSHPEPGECLQHVSVIPATC